MRSSFVYFGSIEQHSARKQLLKERRCHQKLTNMGEAEEAREAVNGADVKPPPHANAQAPTPPVDFPPSTDVDIQAKMDDAIVTMTLPPPPEAVDSDADAVAAGFCRRQKRRQRSQLVGSAFTSASKAVCEC